MHIMRSIAICWQIERTKTIILIWNAVRNTLAQQDQKIPESPDLSLYYHLPNAKESRYRPRPAEPAPAFVNYMGSSLPDERQKLFLITASPIFQK